MNAFVKKSDINGAITTPNCLMISLQISSGPHENLLLRLLITSRTSLWLVSNITIDCTCFGDLHIGTDE